MSPQQYLGVGINFLMQSGRAVLFPIYKSTYERGDGLLSDRPDLTSGYRDHVVQWSKDVARSIDYLETRSDIAADKIGYYGVSWGATMGAIIPAVEERLKALVLVVGGFWQQKAVPEVEQINFAPRVKAPVLMLNGRHDFVFPLESSQTPMFTLLGTPSEHKRHLLVDSGHSVPARALVTHTLQWFDRYLGPTGK
jgi:dienelactone hydrolase